MKYLCRIPDGVLDYCVILDKTGTTIENYLCLETADLNLIKNINLMKWSWIFDRNRAISHEYSSDIRLMGFANIDAFNEMGLAKTLSAIQGQLFGMPIYIYKKKYIIPLIEGFSSDEEISFFPEPSSSKEVHDIAKLYMGLNDMSNHTPNKEFGNWSEVGKWISEEGYTKLENVISIRSCGSAEQFMSNHIKSMLEFIDGTGFVLPKWACYTKKSGQAGIIWRDDDYYGG